MTDDFDKERMVGYGRPPVTSRFKPGQSGNPKGRPKGAKNSSTLLDLALDEKVVITERGRRRRISKREAAFKQFANRLASGDPQALKILLATLRDSKSESNVDRDVEAPLQEIEKQVFELFVARTKQGENENGKSAQG